LPTHFEKVLKLFSREIAQDASPLNQWSLDTNCGLRRDGHANALTAISIPWTGFSAFRSPDFAHLI
jgi:hypothetical protein